MPCFQCCVCKNTVYVQLKDPSPEAAEKVKTMDLYCYDCWHGEYRDSPPGEERCSEKERSNGC